MTSFVLFLIFAASGGAKLLALPFEAEAFSRWGYPPAFMVATGLLEVAGAVGLLVPRLSALASLCLAGLMVGAIGTHVVHGEWPQLAIALAIASLAAWRGWSGRGDVRQLFSQALPKRPTGRPED